MGKVYVINIVHTEHNWWDDKYTGLDVGTSILLQRFREIEDREGIKIPITWCLYFGNGQRGPVTSTLNPDIIDVRKEFFLRRFKLGDEIGIHTHAPDPREQCKFFTANAQRIEAEGFPYPKTHAPGWFYLNKKVFRALEKAEIEIDAGLLVRVGKATHPLGIMLQDCSERYPSDHKSFRPYFPSYENICRAGDCSVLEIPVFLSYHGIEENPKGFVDAFRKQWEHRDEVAVDIVQFFWHPFECMEMKPGGGINHGVINGYYAVYSEIAKWEDVIFSTTYQAAKAWKDAQ